jgi:hypothetical protein
MLAIASLLAEIPFFSFFWFIVTSLRND